jgi:long-chain fatty acid transport protein
MRSVRSFLVLLVAFSSILSRASGDGVVLDGISPRSLSRGGANLAHFDNGGVMHDNPAAMTNIAGQGIVDVGVVTLLTDFGYADDRRQATDTSFTPLPQLACVRKTDDGLWAYGIGLFTPAGFVETFDMQGPFPLVGEQRYKSFGSLMKVVPGASCQLTDQLSLGATLGVGVSHAELEGPYFLQGPSPLAGTPTLLDTQGTGATVVWSLGLQYALTPSTMLGASYIHESSFALHGNTRVDVPLMGGTMYDSELHVTWPRSVGLGIRHELCPHQILSADVIWYGWSSAFDDFGLRLTSPRNPNFPELVDRLPLRWRDTVSVRLGYERQVAIGGTLRFGYAHHRNPIPNATLTPFIQGTLENSFSVGYSLPWHEWEFDLGYMYLFGPDETVETSGLLGGDFNNSKHDAQIHAIFLGFMRRFG